MFNVAFFYHFYTTQINISRVIVSVKKLKNNKFITNAFEYHYYAFNKQIFTF